MNRIKQDISYLKQKLTESKNKPFPKIGKYDQNSLNFIDVYFEDDIEKLLFENDGINNGAFRNATFINCTFRNFRFNNSEFINVKFIECIIEDNITFYECDIICSNLAREYKGNINFLSCKINNSDIFPHEYNKIKRNFYLCSFIDMKMSIHEATNISFSEIEVDSQTIKNSSKNKNITVGLNGIYNRKNGTASLKLEKPKGDEMRSGDEEVILKNLTKAKLSFNTSYSIVLIIISIYFLGINSFSYIGLKLDADKLLLISLPIITFSMYKTFLYFKDASLSIKYINTQPAAVKVGRFPWMLSRFWGEDSKVSSYIVRFLISFHQLLLLFILFPNYLNNQQLKTTIYNLEIKDSLCVFYIDNVNVIFIIVWSIYLTTLYFSFKLFKFSNYMQKPLLFDISNKTDESSDLSKIEKHIGEIKRHILSEEVKKAATF